MKIELKGWSSEGLRCPDTTIDLTLRGRVAPVSLIQMPNGTGKTTTLQLLKAALDGEAREWDPNLVRSFQRPNDKAATGNFKVDLLVEDRPHTFELILDYTEGQARYKTSSPGSGGVEAGYHPPAHIYPFLRQEFINLFIFDGEFADRLLDPQQAEAEKAIDALCQLYLLHDVAETAEAVWKRATAAKKGSPKTSSGLTQWQSLKSRITAKLAELDKAQKQAEGQIGEFQLRVSKLKELISAHISRNKSDGADYEEAEKALIASEGKVELLTADLMLFVRRPDILHPQIGAALQTLKANLDILRLPENTSAQFFVELSAKDECICGREMTDEAREQIAVRAKEYLGAAESGLINLIKGDIDKFTTYDANADPREDLKRCAAALSDAVRERTKADGTVRALRQRRIEQGDDKLAEWERELEEKKLKISQIEDFLRTIAAPANDAEETDDTMSIALLRKRLTEANRKVAEITETVTLNQQIELLKTIASNARDVARERIRGDVLDACNARLNKVLSHDPVQLSRIDKSLHLAHQAGASVGQTLAVGYTFLMTVLERGQNQFPLVVDSPANPLDAGRRRAVGLLLPQLTSQFVGFVISTERLGFVTNLEAANRQIKYLTMFRKTPGTKKWIDALPQSGVTQSRNAAVVEGKDYFNEFDLEEEAE